MMSVTIDWVLPHCFWNKRNYVGIRKTVTVIFLNEWITAGDTESSAVIFNKTPG